VTTKIQIEDGLLYLLLICWAILKAAGKEDAAGDVSFWIWFVVLITLLIAWDKPRGK